MNTPEQSFWKRCSSCKKEIPFSGKFYLCSVSTCKHKRKGYRFCSVPCWDEHLGFANHREAWAEEATAPTRDQALREDDGNSRPPVRKIMGEVPASAPKPKSMPLETLVVVSKVKQYIRELSEYNTSQCCIDALTKKVAEECRKGIARAKEDGRRTVKGRDIK